MLTVVIPTLNEAKFIRKLVDECRLYSSRVIVSDDGSTDATVAEALAAGADVETLPVGATRGAGSATMRGIRLALVHTNGIVVTMDGDGQHRPCDIPKLIAPISSGKAELVTGSRFVGKDSSASMPVYRRLGNKIITSAFNAVADIRLYDSQCGFRAFHSSVFSVLGLYTVESGFSFSTEMLIKARRAGLRIEEVPIECVYHHDLADNSTTNPLKHGIQTLLNTLKWRLWEHGLVGR